MVSVGGWKAAGSPSQPWGTRLGFHGWGERGSAAFPASGLPFLNTSLSSAGVASAPALVFITGF